MEDIREIRVQYSVTYCTCRLGIARVSTPAHHVLRACVCVLPHVIPVNSSILKVRAKPRYNNKYYMSLHCVTRAQSLALLNLFEEVPSRPPAIHLLLGLLASAMQSLAADAHDLSSFRIHKFLDGFLYPKQPRSVDTVFDEIMTCE